MFRTLARESFQVDNKLYSIPYSGSDFPHLYIVKSCRALRGIWYDISWAKTVWGVYKLYKLRNVNWCKHMGLQDNTCKRMFLDQFRHWKHEIDESRVVPRNYFKNCCWFGFFFRQSLEWDWECYNGADLIVRKGKDKKIIRAINCWSSSTREMITWKWNRSIS